MNFGDARHCALLPSEKQVNPVPMWLDERFLRALSEKREFGGNLLDQGTRFGTCYLPPAVDAWFFLGIGAVWVTGKVHQAGRKHVGPFAALADI